MSHQFTIEGGEAPAQAQEQAQELPARQGESPRAAVAFAVRQALGHGCRRRDGLATVAAAELAGLLEHPFPVSGHSWPHDDETGLPA